MNTNKKTLTDRLSGFKETSIRRANYVANFVLGYVQEQLFTTLNHLPFDVAKRYIPESVESKYYSDRELDLIEEEEDKNYDFVTIGAGVGVIQDLALLGLSISYLSGNDSQLANLATNIVATKIGLNILSLASREVYLRITK